MTNKELIDKIKPYPLGKGGLKYIGENEKIKTNYGFSTKGIFGKDEITSDIDFKPILKPLSLLTEEIKKDFNLTEYGSKHIGKNLKGYSYEFVMYLFNNFYDTLGLIESGHAISTLDKRFKGIKKA